MKKLSINTYPMISAINVPPVLAPRNQRVLVLLFLLLCLIVAFLALPPKSAAAAASCQAQHVVQRGENLFRIGQKYGIGWPKIAQANNIADANRIYVGQRLCIPTAVQQPPPSQSIPTFTIIGVVRDQSVTIRTSNFPANRQFDVLMGGYGTKGVNGTWVTSINSGNGGSFTATYAIPASQRGADRIAIRLQSPSGPFSYNWFWNTTTR